MFGTYSRARSNRFEFKQSTGAHRAFHFQKLRGAAREGGRGALIRLLMLFGGVLFLIRWLSR
ncbi:MAG: hypothetical protein DRP97_03630 [Candidatus Latescibacterota bacterium]|nr:MAG: hypothetical protein B1H02_04935 [Candidatus Latescibacteria bacterium 4484_107]RKY70486.1 MAG: hypothetical protein DRP97_03630 [Candidatus Latescibacterota bacterium]